MTNRSGWLLLATILAAVPLMLLQLQFLWQNPIFWYVIVCWIALAVLVYQSVPFAFPAHKRRRRVTRVLVTISAVSLAVAGFLCSPSYAHFSLHILTVGWLLGWLGYLPWTRVLALSTVAWVAWPVSAGFAEWLTLKLEFYARSCLTGVLDYWGVKHRISEGVIDLAELKMDISGANEAAEGLFLLFAASLILLVARRSGLLAGILTFASVPAIWLVGRLLTLLVLVSTASMWGSNILVVEELWWVRILAFTMNVAFLFMVYAGMQYLLEPVITGDEAKQGSAITLNRILLWPLRLEPESDPDAEDELGEEETGLMAHAQLPNREATKKAKDLWSGGTLYFAVMGLCVGAFVLGTLSWFISPVEPAEQGQQKAVALTEDSTPFEISELEVKVSSIAWNQDKSELRSTLVTQLGPASLNASFEVRDFNLNWEPGQPRMKKLVQLDSGAEWPCVEVIESSGEEGSIYQFSCAFDVSSREVFAEQRTLGIWISDRMAHSLYGRFTSMKPVELCNLEVRLSGPSSMEPSKREEMAKLACTILESARNQLSGEQ